MKRAIKDERQLTTPRLACLRMCGSFQALPWCDGAKLNIGLTKRLWIGVFWVWCGWRKCIRVRARWYQSSTITMIGLTQTPGMDRHHRPDTIPPTTARVSHGGERM